MIKRTISLLAIDEKIAAFFIDELNNIFNGLLEISYYTPSMRPMPKIYDTDLILYTDPSILIEMMSHIRCKAPSLMMKRTISKIALEKLKKLPPGKRCLVVNLNSYMANETLTTIYQLGVDHITLYPYYAGMKDVPEVDYIITPGEHTVIPEMGARVIDIGNRAFDISTILDIIAYLNIDSSTAESIILRYTFKVPSFWQGIKYTLENKRILSTQWKTLLNELSGAVMVIDEKGEITLANNQVSEVLGLPRNVLENSSLKNIAVKHPELGKILSRDEIDHDLFIYNGKRLVVAIKRVEFDGMSYGKVVLINLYNEMLKAQQKIHRKIVGKGYFSNHTLDSIVGQHESIHDVKDICKKIADSDSTVLLVGETGTGKELFAGAIHNYSSRSGKPFVAINCATIAESLLESELFGYEEGAFTGAREGGKIGMFERANGGTLFLDEVGEIPLNLQARLLRALQEKEIMRVGGDSIIRVDTRIVAATNKDLYRMVNDGKFREDLFFRLNVFQVDLPPLREKVSDIPLLIEHYMEQNQIKRGIEKDFETFYRNYPWPGNVRELFNALEYMSKISKDSFCFSNLPKYLKKKEYIFSGSTHSTDTEEIFLLRVLKDRQQNSLPTGRRSLCKAFSKEYYVISELEIRRLVDRLAGEGCISVNSGRKGCRITDRGLARLEG